MSDANAEYIKKSPWIDYIWFCSENIADHLQQLALEKKLRTIIGHMGKTGQEVDSRKRLVLLPYIVKKISDIVPPNQPFNLQDVGAGAGSFTQILLQELKKQKRYVDTVGVCEIDMSIFARLALQTTRFPTHAQRLVQFGKRDVMETFVDKSQDFFAFTLAQLVFHHIHDEAMLSYVMYSIYRTMKPGGLFTIVNFADEFIQYLLQHEPEKLTVQQKHQGNIEADYHFDSTGSNRITQRAPQNILGHALGMGFDLHSASKIVPHQVRGEKARYEYLCKHNIPMFHALTLQKNEKRFLSSSQGTVESTSIYGDWLTIHFQDGDEIQIPNIKHARDIRKGDFFLIQETIPEKSDRQFVTYWIIHKNNKVVSGQLSTSIQR